MMAKDWLTWRERVRRAAKRLDEDVPGWAYRVRLSKLNLHSTSKCILGQVFGAYNSENAQPHIVAAQDDGPTWMGIACPEAGHAFMGRSFGAVNNNNSVLLSWYWKDEVRQRRGNSGTRGRRA